MQINSFSTTGIGSLPHTDPEEAVRVVLRFFDIPFWPQLPMRSFREGMIAQFTEGLPFLKVDPEKGSVGIELNGSNELERFYETYTDETLIPISEQYAKGFYAFLNLIAEKRFSFLKGHVTGPLTFSLGLKDTEGRAIYYNEELREISLMLLKAKIRWQVRALKGHGGGVIIFIDEPILPALGSTGYIGVQRDEALRLLRETSDAIKTAGAISGLHCCGRAEWPLLISAGVKIINFDAYTYADTLSIYPEELRDFMGSGGILAWGIIPTTDAIKEESIESIRRRFSEKIDGLSSLIPQEILLRSIMLTPSCGLGSRTERETLKVFELLRSLKESL